MTQNVHLDRRGAHLVLWSFSKTKKGLWVENGEYVILGASAPRDEVAEALERVRQASKQGVKEPSSRKEHPRDRGYRDLGVGSFSEYTVGTSSVDVGFDEHEIEIYPMANEGPRRGFSYQVDKVRKLPPSTTMQEVVDAVLEAFADAG